MNLEEIKINLLKYIWDNLAANFLINGEGLEMDSPHLIIKELLVEIRENDLGNSDNRKYFENKIQKYLKIDPFVKGTEKTKFTLIIKNIHTTRLDYLTDLCLYLEKQFLNLTYLNICLYEIETILVNSDPISVKLYEKLKYLIQVLIHEFILYGYSLKDIRHFVSYIFDDVREGPKGLYTFFPHNLKKSKYKSVLKYEGALKRYIDKLTTGKRLQGLNRYFTNKKNAFYIFEIEGLKSRDDFELGDIVFFSKNSCSSFAVHNMAFDQNKDHSEEEYIRAAVKVSYLLPESTLGQAISKLESALDLVVLSRDVKVPLQISLNKWLVIDKDGNQIYSYSGVDPKKDKFWGLFRSLDLTTYKNSLDDESIFTIKSYTGLLNQLKDSKLVNALHWYRKGYESNKDADRLLSYWISIENIFNIDDSLVENITNKKSNKFSAIKEILSSTQFMSTIHEKGWLLYKYYSELNNPVFGLSTALPKELIKSAQLNPQRGEIVYLKSFIDSLDEIKKHESNVIQLAKIDNILATFQDTTSQSKAIKEAINTIEEDVILIYRLRNLIVHNARYTSPILNYFVWKAKAFAQVLLISIIKEHQKGKTIKEILLNFVIYRDWYLAELDRGKNNIL